jgi:hypothetical protein
MVSIPHLLGDKFDLDPNRRRIYIKIRALVYIISMQTLLTHETGRQTSWMVFESSVAVTSLSNIKLGSPLQTSSF